MSFDKMGIDGALFDIAKVANISKAIKNLQVMKQIPIVAVSQMNRTKNEDKSQGRFATGIWSADTHSPR